MRPGRGTAGWRPRAAGAIVLATAWLANATAALATSPETGADPTAKLPVIPAVIFPGYGGLPPTFEFITLLLYFAALWDPAVSHQTTTHDPWKADINGTAGALPGSKSTTTDVSTWLGGDVSDMLGLSADQRLRVAAAYVHEWRETTVSGAAHSRSTAHTVGGLFAYQYRAWNLSGAIWHSWGDGRAANLASGVGDFDLDGRGAQMQLGRVFTLAGEPYTVHRGGAAPWPYRARTNSLYVEPFAKAGVARSATDAFVDSAGLFVGGTSYSAWSVGGGVNVVALLPQANGWILQPTARLSVDRRLDEDIRFVQPVTGLPGRLEQAATRFGLDGGLNVLAGPNVQFGASAFYRASDDERTIGARAFLTVNFAGPDDLPRRGLPR